MRSELTIRIFAIQIPFDWMIDWVIHWLIHSFIHRVTEWNKGRVWPRSVCLLYQLHTCPVETVLVVVEPELWSMLSRKFTSLWHWNVHSNLSWWRFIHTAQNITIDMYNSYKYVMHHAAMHTLDVSAGRIKRLPSDILHRWCWQCL